MNKESKFTWGDSVKIHDEAFFSLHQGESASICGMRKISSEDSSKKFQCNPGDWVYTVEFGDGNSIEIAEKYLEKAD